MIDIHDSAIEKYNKYIERLNQIQLVKKLSRKELRNVEKVYLEFQQGIAGKYFSFTDEEVKDFIFQLGSILERERLLVTPGMLNLEKKSKLNKKNIAVGVGVGVLVAAIATGGVTLGKYIASKNSEEELTVTAEVKEEQPTVEEKIIEISDPEATENQYFNPNNNEKLVEHMVSLVSTFLGNGIAVSDIMTEEEIKLAKDNEQVILTISELMDYYLCLNIQDIEPSDYARLKYSNKSATMVIENYLKISTVLSDDAYTIDSNSKVNIDEIIADKENAKKVSDIIDYIAKYNDNTDTKELEKEIREYVTKNYLNNVENVSSKVVNDLVYRYMIVLNVLSLDKTKPENMTINLYEDGFINCTNSSNKDDSERNDVFFIVYNVLEEKLNASLIFQNQSLEGYSESELRTGAELEEEIIEKLLLNKKEYKLNEKFIAPKSVQNIKARKSSSTTKDYVEYKDPASGNIINIPNSELAKYNSKTVEEYMVAKQAEFDANAKADPKHTIKDENGNVVASGSNADSTEYNNGYLAGYNAGQNLTYNLPANSSVSYTSGYKLGYAEGEKQRKLIDSQQKTNTYIENNTNTSSNESSVKEETQNYTGEIAPIPQNDNNTNPSAPPAQPEASQPQPEIPQPEVPQQETQPEAPSTEVEEIIEEFDYIDVSSTNDIKEKYMKMSNFLKSLSSQYDNEIESIQKSAKV